MKHLHSFARRAAAFLLAAVLCVCIPAAAASAATTIGGADTTLIPAEDENCLSWLFGSKDKITMPYLNIKGQGLKRNVTLDLVDCLVGITPSLAPLAAMSAPALRSRRGRRRRWLSTPIWNTTSSTARLPMR